MGKILRVNLKTKNISYEDMLTVDEEKFLGGAGVAVSIFTREVKADIDPFDGGNKLIFSVGPFCGTAVPFCGRHFVIAKSPLTNILGESSSGGFFGKELKSAGLDIIIVEGKSESPVSLWINDGKVEIIDASELWGLGTQDTDSKIKELLGDNNIKVATIGPAGENLVKYACIMNDTYHAAGRCGLGAVMGSKKLKAIAVKGTQKVPVDNKENVLAAAKKIRDLTKEDALQMVMSDSGTPVHLDSFYSVGDVVIKNWTMDRWPGVRKIGAKALNKRGEVKKDGCFNCFTACRGKVELDGEWVSRPEYETLGLLGSNLLVDNLDVLIRWNQLVNNLGMDTISLGASIACFLEAIDRKLIEVDLNEYGFTEEQIWGAVGPIEKLIKMIASREGVGNDLAEGVRSFCKVKKLPDELSIHGKGLEVPAHEPRANNLTALDYATTSRGAYHCFEPMHLSSYMGFKKEIGLSTNVEKFSTGDNVVIGVMKIQNAGEAYCAAGGCIFGFWFSQELTPWVEGFNAVTGRNYTVESWVKAGENIFNMKRNYNLKCGITKADDTYGKRFFKALEKGGARNNVPPLNDLLEKYYELREWDKEGTPL